MVIEKCEIYHWLEGQLYVILSTTMFWTNFLLTLGSICFIVNIKKETYISKLSTKTWNIQKMLSIF